MISILGIVAEDSFKDILAEFAVKDDVLADEVTFGSLSGYEKEFDLGGKIVRLSVCRK